MAVWRVVPLEELAEPCVLAPERYHPARRLAGVGPSVALAELCSVEGELWRGGRRPVLDTAHVAEGFVAGVAPSEPGSSKKRVQPGDVLVSRLRPYLRQVGLAAEEACCSTEFFVLRSRTRESIAFLVPFLLSAGPQRVFAASVEGGHHPRFGREVLETLPVPRRLIARRRALSRAVEAALALRRQADAALARLLDA